jgi:hypothetical protein
MRATALLAIAFAVGVSGTVGAQTELRRGTWYRFETRDPVMVGRSPMRLFDQYHWIDANYARSNGATVEPAQPGLEDRALRINSGLALRIGDHQILRLFDQPEVMSEAGPILHRFEAWLSGPRFYVVSVTCIECSMTYLIDARDGSLVDISRPPTISPNGQLGAVSLLEFPVSYSPPMVIDFRSHPPKFHHAPGYPNCEKRTQPPDLRPTAVWLDDTHIRFEGRTIHDDGSTARQVLRIIDDRLEWDCGS